MYVTVQSCRGSNTKDGGKRSWESALISLDHSTVATRSTESETAAPTRSVKVNAYSSPSFVKYTLLPSTSMLPPTI